MTDLLLLVLRAPMGPLDPHSTTHRGHLAGYEVAVLCQHVRHHECGQLWVRIRVDESIVWQRVAEVACGVVLHQVKKRRLGVVRRSDGGDLVVFVPSSVSTGASATSTSSPTASSLTRVALGGGQKEAEINEVQERSGLIWKGLDGTAPYGLRSIHGNC